MPLEEGDTFFFAPRALKNLVMVDELHSYAPILGKFIARTFILNHFCWPLFATLMPTFYLVISAKKNTKYFLVKGRRNALDIGSPNRNYHFIWGAKKKLQNLKIFQKLKMLYHLGLINFSSFLNRMPCRWFSQRRHSTSVLVMWPWSKVIRSCFTSWLGSVWNGCFRIAW